MALVFLAAAVSWLATPAAPVGSAGVTATGCATTFVAGAVALASAGAAVFVTVASVVAAGVVAGGLSWADTAKLPARSPLNIRLMILDFIFVFIPIEPKICFHCSGGLLAAVVPRGGKGGIGELA
jgi:hypothetical protein